jgi:hypothetical protein
MIITGDYKEKPEYNRIKNKERESSWNCKLNSK